MADTFRISGHEVMCPRLRGDGVNRGNDRYHFTLRDRLRRQLRREAAVGHFGPVFLYPSRARRSARAAPAFRWLHTTTSSTCCWGPAAVLRIRRRIHRGSMIKTSATARRFRCL